MKYQCKWHIIFQKHSNRKLDSEKARKEVLIMSVQVKKRGGLMDCFAIFWILTPQFQFLMHDSV